MLITFRSKAWSDITMFGDSALTLLNMMGHSGAVPGALRAGEIPAVLVRLEQALKTARPEVENVRGAPSVTGNPDPEPAVGLRLRAYPLIQLLSASVRSGCDVMWSQEPSAV